MILIETSTTPVSIDPKFIKYVLQDREESVRVQIDGEDWMDLTPPEGVTIDEMIRTIHEQLDPHAAYNQALDDVCAELNTEANNVTDNDDKNEVVAILNKMVADIVIGIKGMKK